MQLVLLHFLGVHGLKGPQTHVQSDLSDLNSALADGSEDFRSKVQASSGGGDAAAHLLPGINGLVALTVFWTVLASNVRRERHVAEFLDTGKEIRHRVKAEGALTEVATGGDFRLQLNVCS